MVDHWQPIETAPKDGTKLLLAWTHGEFPRVDTGGWDDDRHAKNPRPFWSGPHFWGRAEMRNHPPTHWQPLVPPSEGM